MGTPPAPPASAEHDLAGAIQRLAAAPEPLGIELLLLGTGPLAVADDAHGALGLDAAGEVVLIVGVANVEPGTPAAIADELDELARMRLRDLQQLSETPTTSLEEQHEKRFGTSRHKPLNTDQQVIVVTPTEPTEDAWKELLLELGKHLTAVHRLNPDGSLSALEPPRGLRRRTSDRAGWSAGSWVALAAVLLGVGVLLLGLARLLLFQEEPATEALDSPIRTVAAGVPSDATHGNWIGQRRAVTTSRGTIMLLYRTGNGLEIVSDEGNRGRSWRSPLAVSEIAPSSFSVAIDEREDLHVALIDEGVPRIISLHRSATGWDVSEPVDLAEEATTSAVIDIAWDAEADAGYVIWAQPGDDGGEELRWATVTPNDEQLEIAAEGSLAEAPEGNPILANIASGPGSMVLVTYRGPEGGWFSQLGSAAEGEDDIEWQPEDRVPVEGSIGAAALVVDAKGTAHLLLRNDVGPSLEYFRRSLRGGWSSPEQVAAADSIEGVDLPALAVDAASRLVYAFFQTDAGEESSQVQVAFRDPAAGWQGPYEVAPPSLVPEGSAMPVSTGMSAGEPLVFWTSGGDSPNVQAARVVAP